ncbi:MAG: GTP cyclohydrolase I FolE [Bacteroidales bacterium]
MMYINNNKKMKTNGSINSLIKEAEMKLNGTDTLEIDHPDFDVIGDNHIGTSIDTPMRDNTCDLTEEEKMAIIEGHFKEIMDTMGLDLRDDSLKGTPHRVAKIFVREIFSGLNPANKPKISVFENKFNYNQMLVEKNINVNSTCEHHFLPIYGKAHIAYIPNGKVIGLSKLNRIADYFARRPQVQERMTVQIAEELKKILNTEDVAVVVEANHMCVSSRGIQDHDSTTVTAQYHGRFVNENVKAEFLRYIDFNPKA